MVDIIVMFIGMVIFAAIPPVYGKIIKYVYSSTIELVTAWSMVFLIAWSFGWSLHIFGKF